MKKAVIPAAGLGTRFLPATKSQPKEMLPVVDKPSIQYVVEEAVAAGLTDILIITGRGKRAIEDHFDRNFELEHSLEQSGKHELLAEVQDINELADIHYIRQRDPLGLGHAVCVAREHVGDEPFAVILGDDIMVDDARLLRSMIDVHEREHASVLALLEVAPDEISAYGCAECDDRRRRPRDGSTAWWRSPSRGRAVEPRGHRPLRVHARRSSTRSTTSSPGSAASSSSPTPSGCCCSRSRCSGGCSRRAATTSARSSTSCGRTSSSRSIAPTSVPSSRSTSAKLVRDRLS